MPGREADDRDPRGENAAQRVSHELAPFHRSVLIHEKAEELLINQPHHGEEAKAGERQKEKGHGHWARDRPAGRGSEERL